MTLNRTTLGLALLSLCLSGAALAKVPKEQADRLLPDGDLMPMGGEKAGNQPGTIPEWTGGWTQPPPNWGGPNTRQVDPFPADQPKFTITHENLPQHFKHLTPGQIALFRAYPKTFKMNVFETRRTAGAPKFIYEATYQNALNATLGSGGEAVVNGITGIPFPIPNNGHEAVWNHKLRYRGQGGHRVNVQAPVTESGAYAISKLEENFRIQYSFPGIKPADLDNVSIYFLQVITSPPRLAGTITLVHETMDQVKEPRRAWQYNPGTRRLRRAPQVGYDNPGNASDGLRTNDQFDSFNGAMDRYTWKLVGKKEIYVPYNDYRLGSDEHQYEDILKPGHINMDLPRFELHRVWVVESQLKEGTSHIYKRRTFFIDEDSWAALVVDCYDKRDQMWRVQMAHSLAVYDPGQVTKEAAGIIGPVMEVIYDLNNRRYLAMSMNNQEDPGFEKVFDKDYFDPKNVSKLIKK